MSSFVVTKPGEYRVIKQFGRIVSVQENDGSSYGVSFKIPFIQKVTKVDTTIKGLAIGYDMESNVSIRYLTI